MALRDALQTRRSVIKDMKALLAQWIANQPKRTRGNPAGRKSERGCGSRRAASWSLRMHDFERHRQVDKNRRENDQSTGAASAFGGMTDETKKV
jgi:hypothetical protein